MFERLAQIEIRYEEIESEMAKPETLASIEEYKKLAKERTEIKEVVDIYRDWKRKQSELAKAGELFKTETDEDIKTLAREEIAMLEETTVKQEALLREKPGIAKYLALGEEMYVVYEGVLYHIVKAD